MRSVHVCPVVRAINDLNPITKLVIYIAVLDEIYLQLVLSVYAYVCGMCCAEQSSFDVTRV